MISTASTMNYIDYKCINIVKAYITVDSIYFLRRCDYIHNTPI